MADKTVTICLEMLPKKDSINFRSMTAKGKIKLIAKNIASICDQMREVEPKALWVIGWREFAITEGAHTKHVSQNVLDFFDQTMTELSNKYPNLAIVGPLASAKKFRDEAVIEHKAEKVIENFEEDYAWIRSIEARNAKKDRQVSHHTQRAIDIITIPPKSVTVFRNSVYVYQNGRKQKIRKKAPYLETVKVVERYYDHRTFLFKPATKNTQNPIVTLIHPESKKSIPVGIELCREHYIGVLKKLATVEPVLHIVVSDTVFLNPRHLYGNYVIPFSSTYQTQLIQLKEHPEHKVDLYRYNLLRLDKFLYGPLQPFYPLELKILDFLREVMNELNKKHPGYIILNKVKEYIEKGADLLNIEDLVKQQLLPGKFKKFFMRKSTSEVYPTLERILEMINKFKNDPQRQEFNSDVVAPLKSSVSTGKPEVKVADMKDAPQVGSKPKKSA